MLSLLEDVSSQLLKKSTAVHAVGIPYLGCARLLLDPVQTSSQSPYPPCCHGMSRLAKKVLWDRLLKGLFRYESACCAVLIPVHSAGV